MSSISTEELEQKVEAGEEVIDHYFDSTATRVGTPRQMTSRRRQDLVTTNLEMPSLMLDELAQLADELNIRALDEHYLAKKSVRVPLS